MPLMTLLQFSTKCPLTLERRDVTDVISDVCYDVWYGFGSVAPNQKVSEIYELCEECGTKAVNILSLQEHNALVQFVTQKGEI